MGYGGYQPPISDTHTREDRLEIEKARSLIDKGSWFLVERGGVDEGVLDTLIDYGVLVRKSTPVGVGESAGESSSEGREVSSSGSAVSTSGSKRDINRDIAQTDEERKGSKAEASTTSESSTNSHSRVPVIVPALRNTSVLTFRPRTQKYLRQAESLMQHLETRLAEVINLHNDHTALTLYEHSTNPHPNPNPNSYPNPNPMRRRSDGKPWLQLPYRDIRNSALWRT